MVEKGTQLQPYEAMLHARRISKIVTVSKSIIVQKKFKNKTLTPILPSPVSPLAEAAEYNS